MHNDLFRLDGEVAVVIGGTGSLGGGMADALAAAGAKVAVVGRMPNGASSASTPFGRQAGLRCSSRLTP